MGRLPIVDVHCAGEMALMGREESVLGTKMKTGVV